VTVAAVAEMLSLDTADVEAMVASGELPAIRVGPADEWRIEQSVLDGFLEAKYEESRRAALWSGFDFGDIVDIDSRAGRITPPETPPSV
jgi:excisionase family DNA binding protein